MSRHTRPTIAKLKMSITRSGAKKLKQFIPSIHHEAMYRTEPNLRSLYTEVHWKLPSSDSENPMYIGRNSVGRYYLLTIKPALDDTSYNSFYGDINMTNSSPISIEHSLSLLAFTIVACELMQVSDFKEKGELIRYIEGNLEPHVNNELARLSPERASYLNHLYLSSGQPNDWPMWVTPDKDSPEFKTVLMQDDADLLDWATLFHGGHEYTPKRTGESYGSFITNRPELKNVTHLFRSPNSDGDNNALYSRHLSARALRILISGNVHPINKGYAFVLRRSDSAEAIYLAETDPRLNEIKEMRLRNLEKMRSTGVTIFGIDEALDGSPFTVSD